MPPSAPRCGVIGCPRGAEYVATSVRPGHYCQNHRQRNDLRGHPTAPDPIGFLDWRRSTEIWIELVKADPLVKLALLGAQRLLDQRAEAGFRTRGLDTATKVAASYGRARQKGVTPAELLAMYLATVCAINHSPDQPAGKRWRWTRIGRIVHSQKADTQKTYTTEIVTRRMSDGSPDPFYPPKITRTTRVLWRSSTGKVIRAIGAELEKVGSTVLDTYGAGLVAFHEDRMRRLVDDGRSRHNR